MTKAKPVWLELGASALELAVAEFALDEPFSEAVVARMRSVPGTLYAYVPNGVDQDRALQFGMGGLLPPGQSHVFEDGTAIAAVSSLLEARDRLFFQRLTDDHATVCIVPDLNPRPGDPGPPPGKAAFWVNDCCFHWLNHSTGADQFVDTMILAELPWHGLAAICRLPEGAEGQYEIDEPGLRLLGASAEEVSIRAYDGESFLMWRCASATRP